MWYRLVALVLLLTPFYVQAEPCTINRTKVVNQDGSSLHVKEKYCPDQDIRTAKIYYQAGKNQAKVPVLRLKRQISEAPFGDPHFVDLDKDGIYEVAQKGTCGAGPNCDGDIYKLAADRLSMFHYFSGGYAELTPVGGFLVEEGRASCCSWEYHVYPTIAKKYPINAANRLYEISINGAPSSDGDKPECTFGGKVRGRWQVINPPNKKLLKFCENYGPDYTLVRPPKRHK